MNVVSNTVAAKDAAAEGPARKFPVGFVAAVAYGFDAVRWRFGQGPIFNFTFDGQTSGSPDSFAELPYGSGTVVYDVPDGLKVDVDVVTEGSEAMTFRGRRAVDEEKFSAALDASLNVGAISGEASASIATSTRVDTSDTHCTTVASWYRKIYFVRRKPLDRLPKDALTTGKGGFVTDVEALPKAFDPDDSAVVKTFFDFFAYWGTHYLVEGSFGGAYVMRTVLDESIVQRMSTRDIEGKVCQGLSAGAVKEATRVDITASTMNLLQTTDKTSDIKFYETGGPGVAGRELDEFLKTINTAPGLLTDATALATSRIRPVFDPITRLVADAARRATLETAWRAYQADRSVGPVFDGPVTETLQGPTTSHATRNGFVVLCAPPDAAFAQLDLVLRPEQQTGAPVLAQATNVAIRDEDSDHWNQRASVLLPVRTDTWYARTGNAAVSAFIGTSLALGDWTEWARGPAQTDGFLAVMYRPSWTAATISVTIASAGGTATVRCAANQSPVAGDFNVTDVQVASLCVPVPRGATVQVSASAPGRFIPAGTEINGLTLRWMPVDDPNWAFGPPKPVAVATYPADSVDTDGFVIGTLHAGEDGARGYLELRTLDDRGQPRPPLLSAGGVHWFTPHNRLITDTTVLLPVSRRTGWRADVTTTWGSVPATLYWMPVTRRR